MKYIRTSELNDEEMVEALLRNDGLTFTIDSSYYNFVMFLYRYKFVKQIDIKSTNNPYYPQQTEIKYIPSRPFTITYGDYSEARIPDRQYSIIVQKLIYD